MKECTDISNYANDNTSYATANSIESLITSIEEAAKSLFTCFDNNLMKSNADRYHLLISSNEKATNKKGTHEIANTKNKKLLAVHFGSGLSFNYHKICALARKVVKFVH